MWSDRGEEGERGGKEGGGVGVVFEGATYLIRLNTAATAVSTPEFDIHYIYEILLLD